MRVTIPVVSLDMNGDVVAIVNTTELFRIPKKSVVLLNSNTTGFSVHAEAFVLGSSVNVTAKDQREAETRLTAMSVRRCIKLLAALTEEI